jgi:hypothetical protein
LWESLEADEKGKLDTASGPLADTILMQITIFISYHIFSISAAYQIGGSLVVISAQQSSPEWGVES